MTYHAPISKQSQLNLDRRLFQALVYLDVVDTQYEFSRLMGRHQSYFSSLQCKGLPVSAAALACVYRAVSTLAREETNAARRADLKNLTKDIEDEINQRLR
jgi:hypothetical protein